ncbi:MAG: hypothetical protein IPP35_12465 [Elusimicrobia bacterium]|nr:hypothetical protein [Elusimicrobiota bacterium]
MRWMSAPGTDRIPATYLDVAAGGVHFELQASSQFARADQGVVIFQVRFADPLAGTEGLIPSAPGIPPFVHLPA